MFGGKIFKVDIDTKRFQQRFNQQNKNPAAVKIHKDGRLFTCYLGDFESTGGIFATDEHGEQFEEIISELNTEYCIDDMVFDSKGGFYFTDFRGYSTNPKGVCLLCFTRLQDSDTSHSEHFSSEWCSFKYG